MQWLFTLYQKQTSSEKTHNLPKVTEIQRNFFFFFFAEWPYVWNIILQWGHLTFIVKFMEKEFYEF